MVIPLMLSYTLVTSLMQPPALIMFKDTKGYMLSYDARKPRIVCIIIYILTNVDFRIP